MILNRKIHHVTQKNWSHIYRRSRCRISLPSSCPIATQTMCWLFPRTRIACHLCWLMEITVTNPESKPYLKVTCNQYICIPSQARIRRNMIPWTYTRRNNLGYKYKSYPSLLLIFPVSCLAAIFQAGTRILDMVQCRDCRKNVNWCQVINCCSSPVWHIILLQGQTRSHWISHGGFMRQQNQQVWNKQLPEKRSEANSAEGSSNITLWLQPATQFRVHLCLKIATKAEITNNKDLFSTAATWTIKLVRKKSTTPLGMTNGATASSACNKGQKLTWGTIEDQASVLKKTLRQTFFQASSARKRGSLISKLGEHHLQLVVSTASKAASSTHQPWHIHLLLSHMEETMEHEDLRAWKGLWDLLIICTALSKKYVFPPF